MQGITHAVLLDGSGGAAVLDENAVDRWNPGQGVLWVHLNFEDPGARQWIERREALNDIARSALLMEDTRPRSISRGSNLLLALRGVNLNPGQNPEDMVSIRIWTDGQQIVSTHRRRLLAEEELLDRLKAGEGPCCVADWLVDLTDRLVELMGDTVDGLEDSVVALEEGLLAGETEGLRHGLAQVRKQALGIRRFLAPQREALNRLAAEQLAWLDELNALRLREVNDRLIRHIEDIDAVGERAAVAHEELLSTLSEQLNSRTYVFTIIATLFLPLGFFTGLMGINVGGMPGVESDTAFWVVVALCLVIALGVAVFLRWRRWL